MKSKREPKSLLLSLLSGVALGLAAVTALPFSGSHPNLAGYHSVCAFVPLSTLTLLALAGFFRIYRASLYPSAKRRDPAERDGADSHRGSTDI